MATNKTTRIEAINTMLSVIGEPPVNSLVGVNRADVLIASSILDDVSREVQAEGWHFNTDSKVPFIADSVGVLRLELTEATYGIDLVTRDGKIFNKFNLSSTWNVGATIYCTVVYLFEFDTLPQAARHYITLRAARIFSNRMVGDKAHNDYNSNDEFRALITLKEYEGETGDYTMFDNYTIGEIVNRPRIAPRVF
jgi:Tail tubular protein